MVVNASLAPSAGRIYVFQLGVRLDGTACQMQHRYADVFETVVTHLQYICCFIFWGWECTPTPEGRVRMHPRYSGVVPKVAT